MLTYTTQSLAEAMNTDRHKIDQMRRAGILKGIRLGKTYIYSEDHVSEVLRLLTALEADISNEEQINTTAERIENIRRKS